MLSVPDLSKLDQDFIADSQVSQNTGFWEVLVLPEGWTLTGPLVLTERPEEFNAGGMVRVTPRG